MPISSSILLRSVLIAWTSVVWFSAVHAAQESNSQDPAKVQVVTALKKMSEMDIALVGAIEEEEEETAEDTTANGPGGAIIRQVFVSGAGSDKEFEGDLSVSIMKDKSMVFVSKEEFPSLRIFKSEKGVLCNQVHKDAPIDPKKLTHQLSALCNWNTLAEQVDAAVKVRSTPKGDEKDVRVVLDSSILDEAPELPNGLGGAGVRIQIARNPMTPRVVDLIAIFTLNKSNELVGVTYELQYDDPIKSMMGNAIQGAGVVRMQAAQIAPAAPAAPAKNENADKKQLAVPPPPPKMVPAQQAFQIGGNNNGEPTLGKMIRMDFDISTKVPVEATTFAAEAKKLLNK